MLLCKEGVIFSLKIYHVFVIILKQNAVYNKAYTALFLGEMQARILRAEMLTIF